MLILALALIGGMGCAAIEAAGNARYESQQRALQQQRLRRVAELTPAAQGGDSRAMVALAQAMLSVQLEVPQELPGALAWLSRAAQANDGAAQALLGDLLAGGSARFGSFVLLPTALRDRERGLDLLRKAASQACRFNLPGDSVSHTIPIDPARRLAAYLRDDGRPAQAAVWRARSVMHCGLPAADNMASFLTKMHPKPEVQVEQFALLLLSGDARAIAEARAVLAPETIAAAEREAAALRRGVAESEVRYPAPKRKELP